MSFVIQHRDLKLKDKWGFGVMVLYGYTPMQSGIHRGSSFDQVTQPKGI
jgi:hypothetical protein